MVVYEYRCDSCGPFEVKRGMGTASSWERCPSCTRSARRCYLAPRVNRYPPHLAAVQERAQKSRDQPEVVSQVPLPSSSPP